MRNPNLIVYEGFEQNTPPWDFVRLGIPTASEMGKIMAKGQGGAASKTRDRYLRDIMHELLTGTSVERYTNHFMARGHEDEQHALDLYMLDRDLTEDDVKRVPFARRNDIWLGASPDGLVGEDGGVEIKTTIGPEFIDLVKRQKVPDHHLKQMWANMLVFGRKWWDYCVYSRGYHDPFIHRIVMSRDIEMEVLKYTRAFVAEIDEAILDFTKRTKTRQTLSASLDEKFTQLLSEWQEMQLAQASDV